MKQYIRLVKRLFPFVYCGMAVSSMAITDADWTALNSGDLYGANGPVYAQVWYKGNLYIGGAFTFVGNIPVNYIARWDGNKWDSLGSGTDSIVKTIAVDSSGLLYAGGYFTRAGGISSNQIARWNGKEWSSPGNGITTIPARNRTYLPVVSSIAIDVRGYVYIGGNFQKVNDNIVNSLAKWDGTQWSALGTGIGTFGNVTSLVLDRQGNLFVGGTFDSVGGIAVKNIARWDGNKWDSLGSGISSGSNNASSILALAIDNKGNLYAGGTFWFAGNISVNNFAKWDGTTWSVVGDVLWLAIRDAKVLAIAVDHDGNVYAGGQFTRAGLDTSVNYVAMYNGSKWVALRQGINEPYQYFNGVYSLALDGNGGIYAGGRFGIADGKKANNIAYWSGADWNILGKSIDGPVNDTVYVLLPDHKGNLYAGGSFKGGIAKWDGEKWDTLGHGINGRVTALCLDSNGILYAGGLFDSAGIHRAQNIARWDGHEWSGLDLGVSPGPVNALICDARGSILAGGSFYTAGRISANCIVKWNGQEWDSLGYNLGGNNRIVYAFGLDNKGTLYAVGSFSTVGNYRCYNMIKWNGDNWDSIAVPTNSPSEALINAVVFDKKGNFFWSGVGYYPNIFSTTKLRTFIYTLINDTARVIGTINGYTSSMACDEYGNIYVAGNFDSVTSANKEPLEVRGIARWKSGTWEALGSGVRYFGSALAIRDSTLFVGGPFGMAGNKCSPYIAKVNVPQHIGAITGTSKGNGPNPPVTWRVKNSVLAVSGARADDKITLFSLDGRCLRQAKGDAEISLRKLSRTIFCIRIERGERVLLAGMVTVQ